MKSLSCFFGLPPTLSSATQNDAFPSLYREANVSEHFAALTEIQRQKARFITTLGSMNEALAQHSLIKDFDNDLNYVRQQFQSAWSKEAELHFQSTKVYLFAFSFLHVGEQIESDLFGSMTLSSSIRLLYLSGLTAAVRLIDTFSKMDSARVEASPDHSNERRPYLMYYPKIYYENICKPHVLT